MRWKTEVWPFAPGLEVVRLLRPIHFEWKTDGRDDIGLSAEAVALVAPALAVMYENGEVEGVRCEKLNLLLIKLSQPAADSNRETREADQKAAK